MEDARVFRWLRVPFVAVLLLSEVAQAGPITSNTALPVHSGELIFREQAIWMRSTGDPSPMDRDLDVLMAPSVLIYGVNADLMVMGVLPFLYKRIELATPTGRVTRHTSGFGDLTAVARYTAFAVDRPGETFRVAPFAGIKAPTGAQNEADALGRFPQPFQLGTSQSKVRASTLPTLATTGSSCGGWGKARAEGATSPRSTKAWSGP